MVSETSKSDPALGDREKQKHLDLEIREMISALTNRLASLQHVHRAGGSSHHDDDDEDHGARIITLAGNNVGASMRGEMDEKPAGPGELSMGENEAFSTYVNSNFQAINNSIMLGGSYSTNDPGVHMDVSDYVAENPPKHEKKGKKKKRASSRSDQQTEYSE